MYFREGKSMHTWFADPISFADHADGRIACVQVDVVFPSFFPPLLCFEAALLEESRCWDDWESRISDKFKNLLRKIVLPTRSSYP